MDTALGQGIVQLGSATGSLFHHAIGLWQDAALYDRSVERGTLKHGGGHCLCRGWLGFGAAVSLWRRGASEVGGVPSGVRRAGAFGFSLRAGVAGARNLSELQKAAAGGPRTM